MLFICSNKCWWYYLLLLFTIYYIIHYFYHIILKFYVSIIHFRIIYISLFIMLSYYLSILFIIMWSIFIYIFYLRLYFSSLYECFIIRNRIILPLPSYFYHMYLSHLSSILNFLSNLLLTLYILFSYYYLCKK